MPLFLLLRHRKGETQADVMIGIGELSIGAVVDAGLSVAADVAAATVYEEIAAIRGLELRFRPIS